MLKCLYCCKVLFKKFFRKQGGRVVLGMTVVLRVTSWCLDRGSCRFHLVATLKTKVVGWCKGEPLFSVIEVGACVTGSCCFYPVGAGTVRELVLPSSGCYTNRRVGALNKLHLVKEEVIASFSIGNQRKMMYRT
jgi:hypothetical protein